MIVHEDQVVMPSGKDGMYGYVDSKSESVFIVAVDEDNNVYMVQQAHYTTQELDWQCPAGRTDGEAPEVAANRELMEEAGIKAGSITILARGRTASGMTTFKSSICLARDLQPDTSLLDKEEGITDVQKVPLEEVKEMIFRGDIKATESVAAYLLAIAYLEREKTI